MELRNISLRISKNYILLITGIFAWDILSFSILKLSLIYTSNVLLTYLITYNICCIIYILYFNVYYKVRFNLKILLLLVCFYNVGINLLDFLYNEIILIQKIEFNVALFFISVISNLIISSLLYLFIMLIKKWFKK